MSRDEALRYLVTLAVEYADDFGRARKAATQQTLLAAIDRAAKVLRGADRDRTED